MAGFIVLEILEYAGAFENGRWWLGPIAALVPYLIVGWDVIRKSIRNIAHGDVFDENFLMMVATIGAFGIGEYPEAVAVMLLYQIGELFQNYATGRSRESISQLMSLVPETAIVERDGETEEVDPDEVEEGEIIIVRPGEKIPLDGEVTEGESMLDTSALTGESVPRAVRTGDAVISGCVNGKGTLKIRTTKCYEDSTVAKILELVENATDKKTHVENFVTRFARVYTPVVTIGALIIALIPPLFLGGGAEVWISWIRRACIFLVVSCPCALVISVPLGFFGGIGAASRIGVLVKGSNYLEVLSFVKTVVFDKTGTLTKGEFRVTSVLPSAGIERLAGGIAPGHETEGSGTDASEKTGSVIVSPEKMLLEITAHAEAYSTHPAAEAVRTAYENSALPDHTAAAEAKYSTAAEANHAAGAYEAKHTAAAEAKYSTAAEANHATGAYEAKHTAAAANKIDTSRIGKVEEIAGHGVMAYVDGQQILAGNAKLMRRYDIEIPGEKYAGTVVYVAVNGTFAGVIVISDSLKEGVPEAIRRLKSEGVRQTVMLTGDNDDAAQQTAREAGVDKVHSQLLPADKVEIVEKLINEQHGWEALAFVGDGINDAPVLMRSDVGIAMGVIGSDAAIEAADIVLMDDDVRKISSTVKIARKTMGIIHANILFAIAVKVLILILSVAGAANMWMAIFGDVGVLILCIMNAMRLLGRNE